MGENVWRQRRNARDDEQPPTGCSDHGDGFRPFANRQAVAERGMGDPEITVQHGLLAQRSLGDGCRRHAGLTFASVGRAAQCRYGRVWGRFASYVTVDFCNVCCILVLVATS